MEPRNEDVHTVPRDGAWVNEVLGHVVGGSYATQQEAAEAGEDEARRRGVRHRVGNESAVRGSSEGRPADDAPSSPGPTPS